MEVLHGDLFGYESPTDSESDSDSDLDAKIPQGSSLRCDKCKHLQKLCKPCRQRLKQHGCAVGDEASPSARKSALERVSRRAARPCPATTPTTRTPPAAEPPTPSQLTGTSPWTSRSEIRQARQTSRSTTTSFGTYHTTHHATVIDEISTTWTDTSTTQTTRRYVHAQSTHQRRRGQPRQEEPPKRSPYSTDFLHAVYYLPRGWGTAHVLGFGVPLLPNRQDKNTWAAFPYKRAVLRCVGMVGYAEVIMNGTSRKVDVIWIAGWLLFWEWPRVWVHWVKSWVGRLLGWDEEGEVD